MGRMLRRGGCSGGEDALEERVLRRGGCSGGEGALEVATLDGLPSFGRQQSQVGS